MGAVTYIVVPKLKLMFYLGKNINVNEVEDLAFERDLIEVFDYRLEAELDEVLHKDYKQVTLNDISALVEAVKKAHTTLDHYILPIKLTAFLYLAMKKVDPEAEIISDYSERFKKYEGANFEEIDLTYLIRGVNDEI